MSSTCVNEGARQRIPPDAADRAHSLHFHATSKHRLWVDVDRTDCLDTLFVTSKRFRAEVFGGPSRDAIECAFAPPLQGTNGHPAPQGVLDHARRATHSVGRFNAPCASPPAEENIPPVPSARLPRSRGPRTCTKRNRIPDALCVDAAGLTHGLAPGEDLDRHTRAPPRTTLTPRGRCLRASPAAPPCVQRSNVSPLLF